MDTNKDQLELIKWLKQQAEEKKRSEASVVDPLATSNAADRWLREGQHNQEDPEQLSFEERIVRLIRQQDELLSILRDLPKQERSITPYLPPSRVSEWGSSYTVEEITQDAIFLNVRGEAAETIGKIVNTEIAAIQFSTSNGPRETEIAAKAGVNTPVTLEIYFKQPVHGRQEQLYHFEPNNNSSLSWFNHTYSGGVGRYAQVSEPVSTGNIKLAEKVLPVLIREVQSQMRRA